MRISKALCVAGLLGLGIISAASADPVTFNASGSFGDGATLGGTLVINTSNGQISSNGVDLTVIGGNNAVDLTFNTLNGGGSETGPIDGENDNIWIVQFRDSQDPVASLTLEIFLGQGTNLDGFTGGATGVGSLCNTSGNCGVYSTNYATNEDPDLTSGELSVASAPEPASLLLFAIPAFVLFRRQRAGGAA